MIPAGMDVSPTSAGAAGNRRGRGSVGANAMSAAQSTMSEESIKTCSGQFDLESVYKLPMCRMGLRKMESLHLVPNLTWLDLSHNRLAKIENLASLSALKRLVLVDNEIPRIENVEV